MHLNYFRGSLDWTHWTGLTGLDSLDWTHWTHPELFKSAFFSVGQKLNMLSCLLKHLSPTYSCLSSSQYGSKVTCIFNKLQSSL